VEMNTRNVRGQGPAGRRPGSLAPSSSAGLNRMTSADLGLAKQSSLQSADFSTVSDFTLFPGTGSGSLRGAREQRQRGWGLVPRGVS